MDQLFEQFITERKYVKGVSAATVQWYRSSWKCFQPYLTGENIRQGLISGIEALSANNSAISINTYLRCIRAFLRWAHTEGHLAANVTVPKLKEEQKTLSTFTPEHVRRFIQWTPSKPAEKRLQTLVLLLLDSGVRIHEAQTLRRESVDLENLLVTVSGKGRQMRTVPISFEMRRRLYRHLKTHPYPLVFCCRDGGPLDPRNVLRDMKLAAKALGIQRVRVPCVSFQSHADHDSELQP
jgi:integrase/recombinase XerD